MKSTYQLLDEYHDMWEQLGDTEERATRDMDIAGVNQQKVLEALMRNWGTAGKALQASMEQAYGSAQRENERFGEHFQA